MKRGMCEDIKNGIPMRQNRKYKNTNTERHKYTHTQIQHMMNCQKCPTCGIFLKRGLFNDVKNYIHMCQAQIHKYTNT